MNVGVRSEEEVLVEWSATLTLGLFRVVRDAPGILSGVRASQERL